MQGVNKYIPDYLVTPGEVLEEYLEYAGITQASLADRTGLSKKTINEIVNAKSAITAETALRFECVLGRPAHFWSNLERQYQEEKARLNKNSVPFLGVSVKNALTKKSDYYIFNKTGRRYEKN
jgi:addiction module HigA family antidote